MALCYYYLAIKLKTWEHLDDPPPPYLKTNTHGHGRSWQLNWKSRRCFLVSNPCTFACGCWGVSSFSWFLFLKFELARTWNKVGVTTYCDFAKPFWKNQTGILNIAHFLLSPWRIGTCVLLVSQSCSVQSYYALGAHHCCAQAAN